MSLFPAAGVMSESGLEVFSQPGYNQGGANAHALSLVTLLTAGLIRVFGETPFELLHIIHFGITALGLTGLFLLARRYVSPAIAALVVLTSLLLPIVSAQAGQMYLEIPLMAATVWAVKSWVEGRLVATSLWAVVAVAVKPTGVAVGAGVIAASLVVQRFDRASLRWALFVGAPTVLVALVHQVGSGVNEEAHSWSDVVTFSVFYAARVPDLVVLMAVFVTLSGVLFLRTPGSQEDQEDTEAKRFLVPTIGVTTAYFGLFVVLPLIDRGNPILPRYYSMLMPLWVLAVAVILVRRAALLAPVVLVLISAFSIANGDGNLYPLNNINNFALIERSPAYERLLAAQVEAAQYLAGLPAEFPKFYGLPTHYRSSYPAGGYLDAAIPGGVWIATTSLGTDLGRYPDSFYLYFEFQWLGGEVIRQVWDQAERSQDYSTDVARFSVEQFEVFVIRVDRVDG